MDITEVIIPVRGGTTTTGTIIHGPGISDLRGLGAGDLRGTGAGHTPTTGPIITIITITAPHGLTVLTEIIVPATARQEVIVTDIIIQAPETIVPAVPLRELTAGTETAPPAATMCRAATADNTAVQDHRLAGAIDQVGVQTILPDRAIAVTMVQAIVKAEVRATVRAVDLIPEVAAAVLAAVTEEHAEAAPGAEDTNPNSFVIPSFFSNYKSFSI